ncbi:vicilin-like seed storage protein At2g18540 [Benincasa hispida]|uniref:vicilin-like seed storage protein At2g18540 n=1 Tax=Benincasa hispida TaxID=102211 RepID=UPI0018FF7BE1|nr:vicilin-like seed storage protein At2g18540 [Benincasa hispida]
MVVTEDREDPDITPLMRCRKENAPQGSASDLSFLQRIVEEKGRRKREEVEKQEKMLRARQIIASGDLARKLHDEEVHHNNAILTEEERRKLEDEQRILLASEQFEKEMREEEEEEKKKKEEKEKWRKANMQRIRETKRKEVAEWKREKEEKCKERERKQRQQSRLALAQDKGKPKVGSSELAPARRRLLTKKENDDMMMEMVRAFYHGRLHDTKDAVIMKGWTVPFSARDINELYKMKDILDAPGNKIIDDPEEAHMEDTLRVLIQSGTQWSVSLKVIKTLASNKLLPEARLWVYLVKQRLIPTSHNKTVSCSCLLIHPQHHSKFKLPDFITLLLPLV